MKMENKKIDGKWLVNGTYMENESLKDYSLTSFLSQCDGKRV
jgi:hypothetical protein